MRTDNKVTLLVYIDPELRKWLRDERRTSGRSMTFIVENAVQQYRDRLERGRKS